MFQLKKNSGGFTLERPLRLASDYLTDEFGEIDRGREVIWYQLLDSDILLKDAIRYE